MQSTANSSVRMFLIHTFHFHVEVVRKLVDLRMDPALICLGQPEDAHLYEELAPSAEVVSWWNLSTANGNIGDEWCLEPASEDVLQALAPYEATALVMIDRLNYRGHAVMELRTRYLHYVSYWSRALDRHNPSVVVFHSIPHMGHDYVLYQLCKLREIPTRIVHVTHMDQCLLVLQDIEQMPKPSTGVGEVEALSESRPDSTISSTGFDTLNGALNQMSTIRSELSLRGMAKVVCNRRMARPFSRVLRSSNALTAEIPTLTTNQIRLLSQRRRARRDFDYYERVASPPSDENYVYYALHFQPEASTVPLAGRMYDQLHTLKMVAAALPDGWKLYVREHPRQFRRGLLYSRGRASDFYPSIRKIPNTQIISVGEDPHKLQANARAVVTATGTSAWEAVQAGTPGLVFGHPWYEHCPGIERVTSLDECRVALQRVANGEHAVDPRSVAVFADRLRSEHGIRAAFSDDLLSLSRLTVEQNAVAYVEGIVRSFQPREPALT